MVNVVSEINRYVHFPLFALLTGDIGLQAKVGQAKASHDLSEIQGLDLAVHAQAGVPT